MTHTRPFARSPFLRTTRVAAWVVPLLLAACGGGGSDGVATPPPVVPAAVPAQPTSVLLASQAAADALARSAEQRTRDMRLASGLGGGGTAGPSAGDRVQALDARRRVQAVQDYTSTLCSRGSASVDVPQSVIDRFNSNPNATLLPGDTIAISTSQCVVKSALAIGDATAGSFGVGATIDGRFVLALTSRSGSDYLFTLSYSGFSYAPVGGTAFDPLTATLTFGLSGGQSVYTLDLPDARVLTPPAVGVTGGITTVSSGSLRAAAAAAAGGGYADYSYAGWVYSDATGRASAGRVNVAGSNGSTAVVAATATGYSVDITTAGSTTRFSVQR